MKRAIVAAVLAVLAFGGTATKADPPDPIGILNSIRTPPKRVIIQGYYRRIGNTNQHLILCEASAYGGTAILTRITGCTVTSSTGGFVRGVTPVIYPGFEAITVGVGVLNPGDFTACISANARYADGTIVSFIGCEPAIKLEQGYI